MQRQSKKILIQLLSLIAIKVQNYIISMVTQILFVKKPYLLNCCSLNYFVYDINLKKIFQNRIEDLRKCAPITSFGYCLCIIFSKWNFPSFKQNQPKNVITRGLQQHELRRRNEEVLKNSNTVDVDAQANLETANIIHRNSGQVHNCFNFFKLIISLLSKRAEQISIHKEFDFMSDAFVSTYPAVYLFVGCWKKKPIKPANRLIFCWL